MKGNTNTKELQRRKDISACRSGKEQYVHFCCVMKHLRTQWLRKCPFMTRLGVAAVDPEMQDGLPLTTYMAETDVMTSCSLEYSLCSSTW